MPGDALHVLLLGQTNTAEMRPLIDVLRRFCQQSEIREAACAKTALEFAGENWFADLAVVCQSRPDEFSRDEVQRLLAAFPLSRWICCFGLWCESAGRTHDIWPVATRISARTAATRIRHELSVLQDSSPHLPLTAGLDEVFAFDRGVSPAESSDSEHVEVVSPDRPLRNWLCDLLRSAGYVPGTEFSEMEMTRAVVWDVDPLSESTRNDVRSFTTCYPQLPVIAMMNFARPEDTETLQAAGAAAVVAKLAPHSELLDSVHNVIRTKQASRS